MPDHAPPPRIGKYPGAPMPKAAPGAKAKPMRVRRTKPKMPMTPMPATSPGLINR